MFKILIADDEKSILEPISDYLTAKGITVLTAEDGQTAVEICESNHLDLIILDVMMPVMNGLEACKEIRKTKDIPILFLSALGEERDFLNAYRNGCDDYIVKPFPLSVLYEKVLTLIKRYRRINDENKISAGKIVIDLIAHKVYADEKIVNLSSRDYELLSYLIENKNIILSREMILTRIWGYDYDGDVRVVDTHIKRIRKALGAGSSVIKTIFGVGYSVEEVQQ